METPENNCPSLPPPLHFICVTGILIVYITYCYFVIKIRIQVEESSNADHEWQADEQIPCSHLSSEELQEITFSYHKVGSSCSTCAICLENFRQGDICRVMPSCRHWFHAQCIDPWLSMRLTCPTCRAPLELGKFFTVRSN